jgi:DnaK suppressor protein
MNIDPRSGLTGQQVDDLRRKLLIAREQIRARARTVRQAETVPADREVPGDAADQAEISFEQALASEFAEADRERLRDINDALARIDAGRYGLCEATGEPIGLDRLQAQPWARYTSAHQEQLEAASRAGPPPSL